jgi:hypothetical protein
MDSKQELLDSLNDIRELIEDTKGVLREKMKRLAKKDPTVVCFGAKVLPNGLEKEGKLQKWEDVPLEELMGIVEDWVRGH